MGKKKLTAKKCGLSFLKLFYRLRPDERSCLVDRIDDATVNLIGHTVFNSLFTDLNITPSKSRFLAKELAKHKKDLIYIIDPSKPIKLQRKRIKRQSGTGIKTLLSVLIPTIAGLIASKA